MLKSLVCKKNLFKKALRFLKDFNLGLIENENYL